MMNTNFSEIEKSLNVDASIVKPDIKQELPNVVLKKNDVEKDYKYTRGQLYSLIEKGQDSSVVLLFRTPFFNNFESSEVDPTNNALLTVFGESFSSLFNSFILD